MIAPEFLNPESWIVYLVSPYDRQTGPRAEGPTVRVSGVGCQDSGCRKDDRGQMSDVRDPTFKSYMQDLERLEHVVEGLQITLRTAEQMTCSNNPKSEIQNPKCSSSVRV